MRGLKLGLGLSRGASPGGLSLAALQAQLTDAGAAELFLPSTYATTAFQSYRIYPSVPAIGSPVGLLVGVLSPYSETEVLTNRTFDNGGSGWLLSNGATFSGSSAIGSASSFSGIIQTPPLLSRRLYRFKMIVGQSYSYGAGLMRPVYANDGANGAGGDYLVCVGAGDFSAHILPIYTGTIQAYFGSAGSVPIGTMIFTSPSCKLIGGGYICRQATDGNRPTLLFNGSVYYLAHTSGQKLTAYLPASLGSTCTVIYASPGVGAQVVTGVPITSNACDLTWNHSCLAILPSSAPADDVARAAAIINPLAWRTVV